MVETNVKELNLGKDVEIEDGVEISGGVITIGDGTVIRRRTRIHVTDTLDIGNQSIIGENNRVMGRYIVLGRECYTNHSAEIGGGSCYEDTSRLTVGYWFHFGSHAMINTAMGVDIGNEVGLGRFTNLYTHGAYQSILDGFPVSFAPIKIGDNVWIPSATVNPGVTIGDNVVVGVGSVVTKDIPSGALAAGTPCEVKKERFYPRPLDLEEKVRIIDGISERFSLDLEYKDGLAYSVDGASIDFGNMSFEGEATHKSERARNILRRHGIRFKVEVDEGIYKRWD